MKSHVKAVVIGGGVVGCSVLYHLARAGWTDVLLIERSELTSGSSWHAAGGFHTLNGDPNVAKLQAYTVQLYREIEELSGQSCGLHLTGGGTRFFGRAASRFCVFGPTTSSARELPLRNNPCGPGGPSVEPIKGSGSAV